MALTTNLVQGDETLTHEQIGEIANKIKIHLEGLNKTTIDQVLDWLRADTANAANMAKLSFIQS